MSSIKEVAVIAPIPLRLGFNVVLQSAPEFHLIASVANVGDLIAKLGDEKLDVVLLYFDELKSIPLPCYPTAD